MKTDLTALVERGLDAPAPDIAVAFGKTLAKGPGGVAAVLFYGSALRTGDRDGVLDFYVLTRSPPQGLRGLASRALWPDVSYRELVDEDGMLRAKVATMTLAQFRGAVGGKGLDTTVWTRFRAALGPGPGATGWPAARRSTTAVAEAVKTAASFALALGPACGAPLDFWRALFRETYAAEFRVERQGRADTILAADPARYDAILPAAWRGSGVAVEVSEDGVLAPSVTAGERRRRIRAWRLRRALGRPLNVARLMKAAFTFEGAARYAAWKIERHTGVVVPVTPWRERHPILAGPGVLWRLWRSRSSAEPERG